MTDRIIPQNAASLLAALVSLTDLSLERAPTSDPEHLRMTLETLRECLTVVTETIR